MAVKHDQATVPRVVVIRRRRNEDRDMFYCFVLFVALDRQSENVPDCWGQSYILGINSKCGRRNMLQPLLYNFRPPLDKVLVVSLDVFCTGAEPYEVVTIAAKRFNDSTEKLPTIRTTIMTLTPFVRLAFQMPLLTS